MPIKVRKTGTQLKTDRDGFLISQSGAAKIVSPWKEAVEEIVDIYLEHLGNVVHSIYVRGTVSRGVPTAGLSDIDTFAVIYEDPEKIDRSWVEKACQKLEEKYSFASGFEIKFVSHQELFTGDKLMEYRFTIKTQSACVFGEDLAEVISPFKPNAKLAICVNEDYTGIINKARKNLVDNFDENDIRRQCRRITKRIIRTGFALVIDKEQTYTRDLYPSYKLFSKHYPAQERNMRIALELAISPISDARRVASFIDGFGAWLAKKVEEKSSDYAS